METGIAPSIDNAAPMKLNRRSVPFMCVSDLLLSYVTAGGSMQSKPRKS